MKKFLIGLLILVLIIIVAVWVIFANLEPIVKKAVNKFGSEAVGTEVTLDGFGLSILKGELKLSGLKVANPKGYGKPYLFSLDRVFVKLNLKSVMTDTIVIEEITIDRPAMTYEMKSFSKDNVRDILANLEKPSSSKPADKPAKKEEKKDSSKPAKKVIINKVAINETNVDAAIKIPEVPRLVKEQTISQEITLPNIEIKDIGKEKQGTDFVDATKTILKKFLSETKSEIAKATSDISNAAKEKAQEALNVAKKEAEAAVSAAKGKLGDAVEDTKNKLRGKLKF